MTTHDRMVSLGVVGAAIAAAGSLWLTTCEYRATQESNKAVRELEVVRSVETILLQNAIRAADMNENIYGLRLLWIYEQHELIDPEVFKRYDSAFCGAVRLEAFSNRWSKVAANYNKGFKDYVNGKLVSCDLTSGGDQS